MAARQALGGDQKLSAVKTLVATGRTQQLRGDNVVPIEFEINIEFPGKYVRKDETPLEESGPTTAGFNGDALIQVPPPTAPAPARLVAVKADVARLLLGWIAASPAVPLTFTHVGKAEAPQGKADVIDAKGDGSKRRPSIGSGSTPRSTPASSNRPGRPRINLASVPVDDWAKALKFYAGPDLALQSRGPMLGRSRGNRMSYIGRSIGTLALAMLTIGAFGPATSADASQKTAIKDGWLITKLHSLFVPEDALSGSNIDVDVKAGMVTLQGTVPNEAARARAIAIAKGADCVKGVTDQLRLAPAHAGIDDKIEDKAAAAGRKTANAGKKAGRAMDDGWIKSKIYAQFMADWNSVLDDSDIDVDVDKGVVTLNGTVKSALAKTKAASIAKATDGVKSVKDMLKVSTTR
jgi:hyperosmotically inducible protein